MPLGLPDAIRACLFDMDGVLTQTATVHAAAWKEMFDAFLHDRAAQGGPSFRPFDSSADYNAFVDGKPRDDGTRDFLASRGIALPEGTPADGPDQETIRGLGARKNVLVLRRIHDDGVQPYAGSVRYLHAVRAAGLRCAVVSSSTNTEDVMAAAGLTDLLDARVDGNTAQAQNLQGKPRPDTYLAGARAVGVDPAACAVFEDALSGVEAGRAGRFGIVVGVDRVGHADALRAHGADIVVTDLADLIPG